MFEQLNIDHPYRRDTWKVFRNQNISSEEALILMETTGREFQALLIAADSLT